MNNATRNKIDDLISRLENIKTEIEELASEERDKFDNLPEGLQASERGSAMEAAADALDEAVTEIDDVTSALETAKE